VKSSVIPKEEAEKYKIESFFENLKESEVPDLVDKLLNFQDQISEDEHIKIHQILENYFLRRNERLEKQKKFKDFFGKDVEKETKVKPSEKFVDFLVAKTISGEYSRRKSSIIENPEDVEVTPLNATFESGSENEYPKIIRDAAGEVTAIEVQCKCGEIIHIDFEFE
jgi:hypothetical protein